MELVILGAGGTWPTAGGATSGYLLRQDGFNLWVDMGSGTMAQLQQHLALSDVHAVLISHAHPDHFVDIYPFFYARFYGELGEHGLPLFAPNGFFETAAGLVSEESRDHMRTAYTSHGLEPGDGFDIGPFRIETRPMRHLGPSLGFRISAGGVVIAYTGDTGPTEEIEAIGRGANVLLSEATWQDGPNLLPFHLSARQAGEHAERAGVGRLLLTHIWPSLDREVSRAQAAETYSGEIVLASEGMRLEVGG